MKSSMKPILFNTEMVQAILEWRKTETRRIIRGAKTTWVFEDLSEDICAIVTGRYGEEREKELPGLWATFECLELPDYPILKAPCKPGDILWVRETWAQWEGGYTYKADSVPSCPHAFIDRWHPSIHMPIEAARIFLRVTDVRVERLQEITDEGAEHEGICGYYVGMGESAYSRYSNWNEAKNHLYDFPRGAFADLWTHTLKPTDIGKYGWAANPWVWVIEYERCEKPEALE